MVNSIAECWPVQECIGLFQNKIFLYKIKRKRAGMHLWSREMTDLLLRGTSVHASLGLCYIFPNVYRPFQCYSIFGTSIVLDCTTTSPFWNCFDFASRSYLAFIQLLQILNCFLKKSWVFPSLRRIFSIKSSADVGISHATPNRTSGCSFKFLPKPITNGDSLVDSWVEDLY